MEKHNMSNIISISKDKHLYEPSKDNSSLQIEYINDEKINSRKDHKDLSLKNPESGMMDGKF